MRLLEIFNTKQPIKFMKNEMRHDLPILDNNGNVITRKIIRYTDYEADLTLDDTNYFYSAMYTDDMMDSIMADSTKLYKDEYDQLTNNSLHIMERVLWIEFDYDGPEHSNPAMVLSMVLEATRQLVRETGAKYIAFQPKNKNLKRLYTAIARKFGRMIRHIDEEYASNWYYVEV